MSEVKNSNKDFFRSIVLDLETTGLPIHIPAIKRMQGTGLRQLMSHEDLFKSVGHLDITQIGWKVNNESTNHTTIAINSSARFNESDILRNSRRNDTIQIGDTTLKTHSYIVAKRTKQDIANVIMSKEAKGTYSAKTARVENSRIELERIHEYTTHDGRRVVSSEKPLRKMEMDGELDDIKTLLSGDTRLGKNLTGLYGLPYNVVTQRQFQGKGDGSLHKMIEDLYLKPVRAGKRVEFKAWNPFFDLETLRALVLRFGHKDMLAEIDRAYYSGLLSVQGIEKTYQAITYKLAQENPEMAKNFLIHDFPEAFASTGRVGKIANNFTEWQYAAPWNAELAGKMFSFDEKIKKAMPQGKEIHAAGADVDLEYALSNILQDVIKELQAKGVTLDSLDDLVNLNTKDSKIVTNILDAKIKANASKIIGTGFKSIEDFKKLLIEETLKKNKYLREGNLSSIAKTLTKNTTSKISTLGGMASIISAITLGVYGLPEDPIDFTKSNLQKSIKDNKKDINGHFGSKFEHDPHKTYQDFSLLGYGVVLPALSLYGIGLFQAYKSPKLLGREIKTPTSFKEGLSQFNKTITYGAKFVESAIPMTKVFRVGSLLNLFTNPTDLHVDELEDGTVNFTKAIKLTTFKDGSPINLLNKNKLESTKRIRSEGVLYQPFLEQAKKELSNDQYENLANAFSPKNTVSKDSKVIVRIANTKNGCLVYTEELDAAGKKAEGSEINRIQKTRLSFKVDNIDIKQTDIKNSSQTFRHNGIHKISSDPIGYGYAQESLFSTGIAKKYTMEEFLENSGIPKNMQGFNTMTTLWAKAKYKLELTKKGVGEAGNDLFSGMSDNLSNIGKAIVPRTLGKTRGLVSEFTIKAMNQFLEAPLTLIGISPEGMSDLGRNLQKSNNLGTRVLGKVANRLSRTHLGLTDYDLGKYKMPSYLFKFATKRILPAYAAWQAFRLTDHVLGMLTFSQGAGPITQVGIKAYQWSTLAYSKISDITGFTGISKKQEKYAPGSTGLGIFAPSLTAVSMYKAGELLYKHGSDNFRRTVEGVANRFKDNNIIRRVLTNETFRGATNKTPFERFAGWAIKNPKNALFAFGMMPMLPFLPGFLGSSKSYSERKAEFDGKKEVAIRKYRGWLLSSTAYEGGKATSFRRHGSNLMGSDWENKGVIWPNYFSRAAHSLTGGLYGRYMLEEYHAKDQPVYQSAPLGVNVPLIGPVIASTIGRILKPTRTYHELGEAPQEQMSSDPNSGPYNYGLIAGHQDLTDTQLAQTIGIQSEGSISRLFSRMSGQFKDLIGFRGFLYETAKDGATGGGSKNKFTPYAQDATEMYNPAQSMWQYQMGDVTLVGGEFLRRLFVYPEKIWRVNDIKNELNGVSWIPQTDETNEYKKSGKDLTHGTTFDKVPMGWLYGSRKGWEFLFPTMKGEELEAYPDQIRLEILQAMAPYSSEFNDTAQKTMNLALSNQLDPYQEQRYYDTLDQVRQLKEQVYTHEEEYTYKVSTHTSSGKVTSVDENGNFGLDSYAGNTFKLAGVSLKEEDIRYRLLQKKQFESSEQLDSEVEDIKQRTNSIIQGYIQTGNNLDIEVADFDQMVDSEHGIEATVGDLNERLLEAGAAAANTGNIAKYNMQQDSVGMNGVAMAKYWDAIMPTESFWATKLINKKDYLENYLYTQVFNREVKLWSKPIEHLLKPFISTELHRLFGIDMVPSFTVERRQDQEYWDIIKYIKYKTLATEATESGDDELASHYHNLWRATMIGADPTDDNNKDELAALPQNERGYFSRFSNEPDPKKRGKIYKYLPEASKRIYSAIWMKKEASVSKDEELLKQYKRLEEAEGWNVSDEEYQNYLNDTSGNVGLGDYVRSKYIEQYAKQHGLPDLSWSGFSEQIPIEDVELLSLQDQGKNIQDYGFFDNKARIAAYNGPAYTAAIDINSAQGIGTSVGSIMPYLMSTDGITSATAMPTTSTSPTRKIDVETNQYQSMVAKNNSPVSNILDPLGLLTSIFL